MNFLDWLFGKEDSGENESLSIEMEDEELENEVDEDFTPFTCRKCGQLVTNPFERCTTGQQW